MGKQIVWNKFSISNLTDCTVTEELSKSINICHHRLKMGFSEHECNEFPYSSEYHHDVTMELDLLMGVTGSTLHPS